MYGRTLFLIALIGLSATLGGCGAPSIQRNGGPRGTLRFECDQPDAQLEVDENHVGPVGMFAAHGILVRPGPHRIVVHKPGFFPAYLLVEIGVNTVQTVQIALKQIPR